MKGIEVLRSHDIRYGILQTLTKDSLLYLEESFNFFVNCLGVKLWGINPYLDIEMTNREMINQNITNEKLISCLKKYINLWLKQNDSALRIREIDNFLAGVWGKRGNSCSFNGWCTAFFCLEWDGKIYPCDRFSGNPKFLLGDLSTQSLVEILNGPRRLNYAKMVNSVPPDCGICEWRNACHNGCPYHRIGGIDGKYYYCEARKSIFTYLKEEVVRRYNFKYSQKGGDAHGEPKNVRRY